MRYPHKGTARRWNVEPRGGVALDKPTKKEASTCLAVPCLDEREIVALRWLRELVTVHGVELPRLLAAWVGEAAGEDLLTLDAHGIARAVDDPGDDRSLPKIRERDALKFLLQQGRLQAVAMECLAPEVVSPGMFAALVAADLAEDLGAFAHGDRVTPACEQRALAALASIPGTAGTGADSRVALAFAVQTVLTSADASGLHVGRQKPLVHLVLDRLVIAAGPGNLHRNFRERSPAHVNAAAALFRKWWDPTAKRYRVIWTDFGGAKAKRGRPPKESITGHGLAVRFAKAFHVPMPRDRAGQRDTKAERARRP
jgi:hypothetical protein